MRRTVDDFSLGLYSSGDLSRSRSFAADSCKMEYTTLQLKYNRIMSEVRDLEAKLTSKELQLQDLQAQVASSKDSECRLMAMVRGLREEVRVLRKMAGNSRELYRDY